MSQNYAPTIENKKARFEYHFLETHHAGIVLTGTEIKSVRQAKVQMVDAFVFFEKGEAILKDLYISPYEFGNIQNTDPRRPRKLLLKKKEIERLRARVQEQGLSVIPVRMFFSERGFVKVEIALAKGKKLHDKRDTIKKRETERELRRGSEE